MYTVRSIEDLDKIDKLIYKDYKLCYIDEIPETIYDWDEESKRIIHSPGFNWNDDIVVRKLRTKEFNNPEYIPEKQENFAYFTGLELKDQRGDDWNDIPYEHNSGEPYDDFYQNSKRTAIEILKIPFYLDRDLVKYPKDRNFGGNSPFSVDDINLCAIPWIFIKNKDRHDFLLAGSSINEFISLIKRWT